VSIDEIVPACSKLTIVACLFSSSYLVRKFHIFKDAGIPGPKPYPFIGTALKTMSSVSRYMIYSNTILYL